MSHISLGTGIGDEVKDSQGSHEKWSLPPHRKED
jgi:hypothetical protein